MKKKIKRAVVRACWWVFPPLGTTINEVFGGRKVTGLWGSYESRRPKEEP